MTGVPKVKIDKKEFSQFINIFINKVGIGLFNNIKCLNSNRKRDLYMATFTEEVRSKLINLIIIKRLLTSSGH